MIDHLLQFTDPATAQVALADYFFAPSGDNLGGWRGDICIPGVSVYAVTGTQTVTNPDTGLSQQQETKSYYPGWFIIIALPGLDPSLRDLSNTACRLIADREAGVNGDPNFILYLAPDIDRRMLAVSRVEPTFAGSDYPFAS